MFIEILVTEQMKKGKAIWEREIIYFRFRFKKSLFVLYIVTVVTVKIYIHN